MTTAGFANQEKQLPMQPDTLFRMFSMTKPITAAATMMLWEQGKLELTDPVSWYIPTFRNQMVDAAGKLVPAERELILQDLLNMTSGIPYPDCHTLSQKKWGPFMMKSTPDSLPITR